MAQKVPGLGIGLHLNFCYGAPISDPATIPSLVDVEGRFTVDTEELRCAADADDISREAVAQIGRFKELVGRDPSHLDSHKYLHSCSPFAAPVAVAAAENGFPVRAMNSGERELLRATGVAFADRFEGRYHGLDGDGVGLSLLLELIRSIRPGVTELMCHPGHVDGELADSSYRLDRECELQALCSMELKRLIDQSDICLSNYERIWEGRAGAD